MLEEKIALIHDNIQKAQSEADSDVFLEQWVAANRGNLHRLIHVPEDKANAALKHFVVNYITLIPECLNAFYGISKKLNISDYTSVFLTIAADFFLSESTGVEKPTKNTQGLVRFIDEAYLAHRVFEELNDRFDHIIGKPVLPIDTLQANLIMHNLLGESYANELDTAVLYSMEVNYIEEKRALSKLQPVPGEKLAKAVELWPTFGEDLFIHIKFMYE